VNPGPGDALVLFLNGGGACWDASTCFVLKLAGDGGPYGAAQFQAELPHAAGSILDRTVPGSPFADATLVFVPYCTGDVHWGDSAQDYPGAPRRWRHAGATNLTADVGWLAARITAAPPRLVISGASAGGFGSLLAHDVARKAWPASRGYLVDDSGPPLVGDDVPTALRAIWFLTWRLDRTLGPLCPGCARDLSQVIPALQARYPADRIGLLSTRQDAVIRSFLLQTPAGFERALLQLVDTRLAGPGAAAFLVPGEGHALLQDPATWQAGGLSLPAWLDEMVTDAPVWTTVGR
jgi:hypothetical protein